MRPSQCAAAILHTRVSGAISAGARNTSRPGRSSARKYVSTKAKGRKATRILTRQIRHMLPTRGKVFAGFCTEARKHIRDIAAAVAGQQLLTAHVRGIQARLRQRQAPARQRVRQAEQEPRKTIGLAAGDGGRLHVRRRARDAGCPRPGQTARPRFSTGKCASAASSGMACAARSTSRASITSSRSGAGRSQRCTAARTASAMGLPVRAPAWGASSASRHHCSRISPIAGSRVTSERHARQLAREGRQRQQVRARGRRGQQRGKVAVGLARARGRGDGVAGGALAPPATSVEVRRRHHGEYDGQRQHEIEPGE